MRSLLLLALLSATAHAETKSASLGNGYSLGADANYKVFVKKGTQVAPLTSGNALENVKVDTKAGTVTAEVIDNTCIGITKYTWSFAQLDARLDNAAGMALHLKKDYKGSAAAFEKAVAHDPKWAIAAYNLASARQLQNDKPGAVKVLAPFLASDPITTYHHVVSDPELAPLLDRPELVAVKSKQAGNAVVTADGIKGNVAFAPDRKLIAYTLLDGNGMSASYTIHVHIFDVTTGAKVASMQLVDWSDTRPDDDKAGLTATGKTAVAARAAKLQRALDDLGFSAVASESSEGTWSDNGDKKKASFTKAKLGIVEKDGTVRVLRGNTTLGQGSSDGPMMRATYVETAKIVIVSGHRSSAEGCDGGPETGLTIVKVQ